MRSGEFYKATENYVKDVCGAFIAPLEDWESIECRHTGSDGISYIRMTDAAGMPSYFEATGLTIEQVGYLVAKIIAGEACESKITNYEQCKQIARLFR